MGIEVSLDVTSPLQKATTVFHRFFKDPIERQLEVVRQRLSDWIESDAGRVLLQGLPPEKYEVGAINIELYDVKRLLHGQKPSDCLKDMKLSHALDLKCSVAFSPVGGDESNVVHLSNYLGNAYQDTSGLRANFNRATPDEMQLMRANQLAFLAAVRKVIRESVLPDIEKVSTLQFFELASPAER